MRVVAGTAGGIPLLAPKSDARPTMDRVKAAIFSSLGALVPGSRVLDLFAGSGALGIEALSRGAAGADFVESSAMAAQAILKNLDKCRLQEGANVIRSDVYRFLAGEISRRHAYDLVFADPPYEAESGEVPDSNRLLMADQLASALAPDGIFVMETSTRWAVPGDLALWEFLRAKKYGKSLVTYFRKK